MVSEKPPSRGIDPRRARLLEITHQRGRLLDRLAMRKLLYPPEEFPVDFKSDRLRTALRGMDREVSKHLRAPSKVEDKK